MREHQLNPLNHTPQRQLAYEMTEMVHGSDKASSCRIMSEFLFDDKFLDTSSVLEAFKNDARLKIISKQEFIGKDIVEVTARLGIAKSLSIKLILF
jgi:tyrosyl-tRNA synthetase